MDRGRVNAESEVADRTAASRSRPPATSTGALLIAGAAPLVAVGAAIHVVAANAPDWVAEFFDPIFAVAGGALALGLVVCTFVAVRGMRRGDRSALPQVAVCGLVLLFAYLSSMWALLRGLE
ncbi:hypothetical protein [Engelhardtia mirabilis]|uniref:Uncharacterized protein n=1 Tax=Engelhardtia mirabilis TaxID=2528011 RepID=A0A518BIM4_9BACT|nr:hypothetical protein Pla133_18970 [Planctomycetes bacterium Pla133]QDV01147.1 hypothetical protein Pla86_18960 [Planctomycetes bacterium Pla86]